MSRSEHLAQALPNGVRCDDGVGSRGAHAVGLRAGISLFDDKADRLCRNAAGPIGVAVSGGGDSVAMFILAHRWATARDRPLLALSFDHDLRAESAAEAEGVAKLCAQLGVPHRILKWNDPRKGQAVARFARHGALAAALREAGGDHLMMGHTANDQRETFLMRARQGSHWYGLAGIREMSVSPAWPEGRGVVLVRPLLDEQRVALRDFLKTENLTWVDDPSNLNAAYERIRMRNRLSTSPSLVQRIDNIRAGMARLRAAEDKKLADWLAGHVDIAPDGCVRVQVNNISRESLARALSMLLQLASGGYQPPRGDAVMRLVEQILATNTRQRHTLSGVVVTAKKGELTLLREVAAIPDMALDGDVWDRRFVRSDAEAGDIDVTGEDISANIRATLPRIGCWDCLLNERFCTFLRMLDPKR